MKKPSWHSSLIAIAVIVACVLGCNRSQADVAETDSNEPRRINQRRDSRHRRDFRQLCNHRHN